MAGDARGGGWWVRRAAAGPLSGFRVKGGAAAAPDAAGWAANKRPTDPIKKYSPARTSPPSEDCGCSEIAGRTCTCACPSLTNGYLDGVSMIPVNGKSSQSAGQALLFQFISTVSLSGPEGITVLSGQQWMGEEDGKGGRLLWKAAADAADGSDAAVQSGMKYSLKGLIIIVVRTSASSSVVAPLSLSLAMYLSSTRHSLVLHHHFTHYPPCSPAFCGQRVQEETMNGVEN